MPDHKCEKEAEIASQGAIQGSILEALKDIKHGQERFISVLETIASQGTKITKLEKDTDEVFIRLRKNELDINSQGVRIGLFSALIAMVVGYFTKKFGG
jgi:hypothetical protein